MNEIKKRHILILSKAGISIIFGLLCFNKSIILILVVLEHGDNLRCILTGFNHGIGVLIGSLLVLFIAFLAIFLGFILIRKEFVGMINKKRKKVGWVGERNPT
ncbi:MAG: hypothetical protein GY795_04695 [Desulfobacterales bacterium]|nr:hypothetical protein [Desulfobacterales bacterium]